MAKKIICKSCRQPCIVDGNEITCETCGTTFVKQGDEVKPVKIGRLDNIEQRLDALEKGQQTESEPGPEPEPEPEPNQDQEGEEDW